jgi:hypothetical protein
VTDTQAQFDNVKAKLERKYDDTKVEVDKMAHNAKTGWFSWWRWGSSKADQTKKSGAAKAAEMAEDARKHT